jgi:hypothetical protein
MKALQVKTQITLKELQTKCSALLATWVVLPLRRAVPAS